MHLVFSLSNIFFVSKISTNVIITSFWRTNTVIPTLWRHFSVIRYLRQKLLIQTKHICLINNAKIKFGLLITNLEKKIQNSPESDYHFRQRCRATLHWILKSLDFFHACLTELSMTIFESYAINVTFLYFWQFVNDSLENFSLCVLDGKIRALCERKKVREVKLTDKGRNRLQGMSKVKKTYSWRYGIIRQILDF